MILSHDSYDFTIARFDSRESAGRTATLLSPLFDCTVDRSYDDYFVLRIAIERGTTLDTFHYTDAVFRCIAAAIAVNGGVVMQDAR